MAQNQCKRAFFGFSGTLEAEIWPFLANYINFTGEKCFTGDIFVTGDVTGEDFVTGDVTVTVITGETVTAVNSAIQSLSFTVSSLLLIIVTLF